MLSAVTSIYFLHITLSCFLNFFPNSAETCNLRTPRCNVQCISHHRNDIAYWRAWQSELNVKFPYIQSEWLIFGFQPEWSIKTLSANKAYCMIYSLFLYLMGVYIFMCVYLEAASDSHFIIINVMFMFNMMCRSEDLQIQLTGHLKPHDDTLYLSLKLAYIREWHKHLCHNEHKLYLIYVVATSRGIIQLNRRLVQNITM